MCRAARRRRSALGGLAVALAGVGAALVISRMGAAAVAPDIVVLYSRTDSSVLREFSCPAGRCRFLAIEDEPCAEPVRARTVIVTGHSRPPRYLGRTARDTARAASCSEPDLVVLDSCYAFSIPLLEELATADPTPLVVGSTKLLPRAGLKYGSGFFDATTSEGRADAVQARDGGSLERWRLDAKRLRSATAQVEQWSVDELEKRLRHVMPNLVTVQVPGERVELLAHVDPQRFLRPAADESKTRR